MSLNKKALLLKDVAPETVIVDRILVCDQISDGEVLRLATDRNASQIIQEKSPEWENEMKSSGVMIDTPLSFLDFPLCTILTPDNVNAENEKKLRISETIFSKSSEKANILAQVEATLKAIHCPKSFITDLQIVADELVTNAIYNAAFADTEIIVNRQKSVDVCRDCRLVIGMHDGRLVMACEDQFGSLDINKLLGQVRRCVEEGVAGALNWGDGGAGIGSYMVFLSSISMYYGVHDKQKTIVACVFPLGRAARTRHKIAKCIHFVKLGTK